MTFSGVSDYFTDHINRACTSPNSRTLPAVLDVVSHEESEEDEPNANSTRQRSDGSERMGNRLILAAYSLTRQLSAGREEAAVVPGAIRELLVFAG